MRPERDARPSRSLHNRPPMHLVGRAEWRTGRKVPNHAPNVTRRAWPFGGTSALRQGEGLMSRFRCDSDMPTRPDRALRHHHRLSPGQGTHSYQYRFDGARPIVAVRAVRFG